MLNLARKLVPISLIAFAGCTSMMSSAGVSPSTTDMGANKVAALTWTDLVVPGFPTGGKLAVLSGNPGAAEPYVLRLQFPDGYEFPEHWHPGTENLTVLSGSFHLAMGGAMTGPMKEYAPGDFIYIPARSSHLGGAKGTTVIQLHGVGPFAINLGRP
jgi:quercetin dioxygenase-like cupin family protein